MKVLIGRDEFLRRRFTVRWLFEPRDLWLGVFWNRVEGGIPRDKFLLVYVCFVPSLPFCIAWRMA